jgi:hypothetical protein
MLPVPILGTVALVLTLAIAIILVRQYLRTRNIGFVWLGVAVVIWPVVSRLLAMGERSLIDRIRFRHQVVGFYPFTLVVSGQMTFGSLIVSLDLIQQVIGVCLMLAAVLYLSKPRSNTRLQVVSN